MEYKVKEVVIKATLNYLANKPFNEVASLINALQKSEIIEEVKEKPKK